MIKTKVAINHKLAGHLYSALLRLLHIPPKNKLKNNKNREDMTLLMHFCFSYCQILTQEIFIGRKLKQVLNVY